MACCDRNIRIMLILVACLALWDLGNCAVIRTAHLSKRNYDRDWWKDLTLPTLPTFDWERFTPKPEDRDDKPTPTPFDRKRFTIDLNLFSFDWFRPDPFTEKPHDWDREKPVDRDGYDRNRFTRNEHNNIRNSDTGIILVIVLSSVALTILVVVLKYTVCKDQYNSDTSPSTPVLHPPPEGITAPPTNAHFSSQNHFWTTTLNAGPELHFPILNENSHVTNSFNRRDATDSPPAYSDVVQADLSGQKRHFPEVKSAISEEPPPPQYDAKNMKY